MRRYEDDELGLVQLLQELEPIRGTFPPVYMLGEVLIGYDKLEQLTILAARHNEPTSSEERTWLELVKAWLDQLKGQSLIQAR
jgi:hypothetical protein